MSTIPTRTPYQLTVGDVLQIESLTSPDLDRSVIIQPDGTVTLPFDIATGLLRDEVWQRWLAFDPVRMAPRHADALRSLRHIHIEAGRGDEYMLDVGSLAFSDQLTKLNIDHTVELFDGGHGGNSRRYAPAIRTLLQTL